MRTAQGFIPSSSHLSIRSNIRQSSLRSKNGKSYTYLTIRLLLFAIMTNAKYTLSPSNHKVFFSHTTILKRHFSHSQPSERSEPIGTSARGQPTICHGLIVGPIERLSNTYSIAKRNYRMYLSTIRIFSRLIQMTVYNPNE